MTGSTSAKKIKDNYASGVQLQEFDTYSKCVEALSAGSIDAVTTDNVILAGFAAQPQYQGKLKVVGKPFSEERYGVGIKKGDTELCGKINAALEKMVSDGAWEKAIERHGRGLGLQARRGHQPAQAGRLQLIRLSRPLIGSGRTDVLPGPVAMFCAVDQRAEGGSRWTACRPCWVSTTSSPRSG